MENVMKIWPEFVKIMHPWRNCCWIFLLPRQNISRWPKIKKATQKICNITVPRLYAKLVKLHRHSWNSCVTPATVWNICRSGDSSLINGFSASFSHSGIPPLHHSAADPDITEERCWIGHFKLQTWILVIPQSLYILFTTCSSNNTHSSVNINSFQNVSPEPIHTKSLLLSVIFITKFISQWISFMTGILIYLLFHRSYCCSATKSTSNVFRLSFLCLWPWFFVVVYAFCFFSSAQTHKWKWYFSIVFHHFASVFLSFCKWAKLHPI